MQKSTPPLRGLFFFLVLATLLPVGCGSPTPAESTGISLAAPVRREPWAGQRGVVLVTPNYNIYTTYAGEHFRSRVGGFMEAALTEYSRLVPARQPLTAPMPIYMLATRNEWSRMTQQLFGRNATPAIRIENGAYTVRGVVVGWPIGGISTWAVLAHEGMHQYLHYALADRLPLWAEESLTTACEGFVFRGDTILFTPGHNVIRLADLRRGILAGRWMPMATLLGSDVGASLQESQQDVLAVYGQWYALGVFLRSDPRYRDGWAKMLADAAEGRFADVLGRRTVSLPGSLYHRAAGVKLFEHYIDEDLGRFEKRFIAFARKLARIESPSQAKPARLNHPLPQRRRAAEKGGITDSCGLILFCNGLVVPFEPFASFVDDALQLSTTEPRRKAEQRTAMRVP
jgi:hypothetical protein